MEFLSFSQTKLGSSFDITRARVGGASVIPLLSSLLFSVPPSCRKVLGAKPKQAGKKEGGWGEGIFARLFPFPFRLRKGKAEGGFGGNSAFPFRNQIVDSPATCLNTWKAEHRRKILFSLEKKEIGRAQNEKSKEYFPAGHASEASGGGAVQSVFRSKKVRAKDIISPPIETSRFERIAPRGRVAAALRKTPRRFAAKRLGGLNSKRADLSVSYLKTI